jgi:hypothetical protein
MAFTVIQTILLSVQRLTFYVLTEVAILFAAIGCARGVMVFHRDARIKSARYESCKAQIVRYCTVCFFVRWHSAGRNKKASRGLRGKLAVAKRKGVGRNTAADSDVNILPVRKFQVNDVVRVVAEGRERYRVLIRRDHEPCCQIQRNNVLNRLEWMFSEELELVCNPADANEAGASATDPGARVS